MAMLHTSIFLVHAVEVTGDMGTSSEFCTQKDDRFNSDDITDRHVSLLLWFSSCVTLIFGSL